MARLISTVRYDVSEIDSGIDVVGEIMIGKGGNDKARHPGTRAGQADTRNEGVYVRARRGRAHTTWLCPIRHDADARTFEER